MNTENTNTKDLEKNRHTKEDISRYMEIEKRINPLMNERHLYSRVVSRLTHYPGFYARYDVNSQFLANKEFVDLKPEAKDELGVSPTPPTLEAKARADAASLVTLPRFALGAACANCSWFRVDIRNSSRGDCDQPEVNMEVSAVQHCKHWGNSMAIPFGTPLPNAVSTNFLGEPDSAV